jgi:CHAT domain-containing protein/tetratricopeptide (TPR) repeat protein
MRKESFGKSFIIKFSAGLLLLSVTGFAQETPPEQEQPTALVLGTPVNSEITDGKPKQFKFHLSANQSATLEVDQSETDVTLTSFDPAGGKMLEWGLPLGRVGNETILVIAENFGEYLVEVSPGNRHARAGKFSIKIIEIRETTDDDRVKNRAAKEITDLTYQIEELRADQDVASYRKVIEDWKKVVELAKVKKDKVAEARALHSIGNLLLKFGEIQPALDINLQILEMWREQKNRRMEMIAAGRIATIWYQTGEYEKALVQSKEVLAITRETGSKSDESVALSNIGSTYLALNQPETAISIFEKALSLVGDTGFPIFKANTLFHLGRANVALGNYPKGIENLSTALEIYEKQGASIDLPPYYLVLGRTYLETGESEKAFDLFQKAEVLSNKTGSQRYEVQSLYWLALVESRRGNTAEAIENLESGLKLIEKIRGEIRNKDLRTSYFSTVQNFYELYIDLLIERSKKDNNSEDVALAFEMSERSRSRSLIDLLQEARVDLKNGISPELLEKQKNLADELNNKYSLREDLFRRKSKPEQIDEINTEINALEIEAETVNVRIAQENPRYAGLLNGRTLAVKDVQNLLDDETVLLEYKLGEKRSFLWLVTKDSVEYSELPNRRKIEEKAVAFYDSIIRNDKSEQAKTFEFSRDLSEILLSPVAAKLSNKRLAIVADGVLQYTPFSALASPKSKVRSPKSVGKKSELLIQTNEIVMLPSASVLAQLRANPDNSKTNDKTIAIFADPVFDLEDARIAKNSDKIEKNESIAGVLRDFNFGENLPRLLASRQEAKNISNLAAKNKAVVRTDFAASVKNIKSENLENFRILHFATHGLLNSTRPELSGLVFSLYDEKGNQQDGFLGLNDIYNLELQSHLVVLSACQTALGKDVRGEGLIGLSRGFLYAGSKRIMASLWKVDDAATAEFMKRFYTNHLQKGLSATESLRQTKIEMQKIPRYRSPYYWSAFMLLGDWK